MVATYDIDLNAAVQRVSCFHPLNPPRDYPRIIVADTSALLHPEQAQMLRSFRGLVFVTEGVCQEIEEIAKETEQRPRNRFSLRSRQEAVSLTDKLRCEGRVLDVKTEHNPTLAFENQAVLYTLSDGITKTILQRVVLNSFEKLYSPLQEIYTDQRRKRGRTNFFEITDVLFWGETPTGSINAYRALRAYFMDIEASLESERMKTLQGLRVPGEFNYEKYMYIMRDRISIRPIKTEYFFRKLVIYALHRIDEGLYEEDARENYRHEKRNKRSTDRKVTLASYALAPLFMSDVPIGLATLDGDQSELLRLRKASTIDYSQVSANVAK